MKRKLFNLAAALSLMLTVAVCVLWLRSYLRLDEFHWIRAHSGPPNETEFMVQSSFGRMEVWYCRLDNPRAASSFFWASAAAGPPDQRTLRKLVCHWSYGGILIERSADPLARVKLTVLVFPYWFITLIALPLPLLWHRWRITAQRERKKLGLCLSCGYDLRATPDRCPECGAATSTAPTT